MKIGIDISQIAYKGTGVATYTKNLVKNLLKTDKDNEYILFFSSLRGQPRESFLDSERVKIKNYKLPPSLLEILWNRIHILPVEKFIGRIDIYHSSDWTQAPSSARKITTIHDLAVFRHPEWFPQKIIEAQKRRLNWVKKECDVIIAVSESTKKDIMEILGIEENKIYVIYEAAGEEFLKFREGSEFEKNRRRIKFKYDLNKEYILSVGIQESRKNLERIIQAFKKLKTDDIELVIAGRYGWGEEYLTSSSSIKHLGFVPQNDLPLLYSMAKCLVYAPFYEGFGLPVIEAMATGCPVITSNTSSLPEVGGEAALYVNPYNIEEMTDKMDRIIRMNKGEYEQLCEKSLKQAGKFSWKKAAEQTLRIYQRLC